MVFYQTMVAIIPYSFKQQVKVTIITIINESSAIIRLAWLISNASASQLITTSHESHAAYQPHS